MKLRQREAAFSDIKSGYSTQAFSSYTNIINDYANLVNSAKRLNTKGGLTPRSVNTIAQYLKRKPRQGW